VTAPTIASTGMDVDVLDGDALLTLAAVTIEGFDQSCSPAPRAHQPIARFDQRGSFAVTARQSLRDRVQKTEQHVAMPRPCRPEN